MKDVKFVLSNGGYSITPHYGATPVDFRTAEEKAEIKSATDKWRAKLKVTKKPTPKVKMYWELDAVWLKDGISSQTLKKVCVPDSESEGHYKWQAFSYAAIAKSNYYGNKLVPLKDGQHTVAECINVLYPKIKQRIIEARDLDPAKAKDLTQRAYAFKKKLDLILDINGKRYAKSVKDAMYTPDKKIQIGEADPVFEPDDDTIIACYPVQDFVHKYEITAVPQDRYLLREFEYTDDGYKLYLKPVAESNTNEGFIINTNADVKLDKLLCHKRCKTLYSLIERGKAFGVSPRLIEGFYRIDKYTLHHIDEEEFIDYYKPEGIFGYCITYEAYKEFQQIINWYEGNADLLEDYSDMITIFHEDGVQTKTISEYEYRKHIYEYQDWRTVECRDFQYECHRPKDEYEKEVFDIEGK